MHAVRSHVVPPGKCSSSSSSSSVVVTRCALFNDVNQRAVKLKDVHQCS